MTSPAQENSLRILLVLPRDRTYYYKGSFRKSISYAPLTLTTLAAMVPGELNARIDIVDEGVQQADYDQGSWDIAGITCCASSSPRAYALCDYFKKRGILTVLGGAHPTLMPEEAGQHADAVIAGAADVVWPQLLRDRQTGRVKKSYRQTACGRVHHPVARRDLEPRGAYLNVPTVIATLGCGNRCDFCSINRLWEAGQRRDIAEVVGEISALGSERVLFLDPNLTGDAEYAKELFRQLIPLRVQWAGLGGTDLARDRELLDLAVRSGCKGILMGFESFCAESLALAHKDTNDVSAYRDLVDTLHKHDIGILGTFMLGLDADTPESLMRMPEQIDALGLDIVRFSVLTPFPGTRLFDRFAREGRIITRDWRWYDQEHVVFQPRHMSPRRLQELLHAVWRQSFSLQRIFRRVCSARDGRMLLLAANLGFRHYAAKLRSSHDAHLQSLPAMFIGRELR